MSTYFLVVWDYFASVVTCFSFPFSKRQPLILKAATVTCYETSQNNTKALDINT